MSELTLDEMRRMRETLVQELVDRLEEKDDQIATLKRTNADLLQTIEDHAEMVRQAQEILGRSELRVAEEAVERGAKAVNRLLSSDIFDFGIRRSRDVARAVLEATAPEADLPGRCPKTRMGDGRQCIRAAGHDGDCARSWRSVSDA